MSKLDNIVWEIEPDEIRERNEKMIRVATVALLGILLYLFLDILLRSSASGFSFSQLFFFLFRNFLFLSLFVLLPAFVFYYINKKYSYDHYSYSLDTNGFEMIKNGRKERYSWDEFSSFYDHSKRSFLLRLKINEAKVKGRVFYLRKKKGFFNSFVAIYSEPDSSFHVYGFILDHLKEEV